jgi:maltooligosyltrehalose trehalohydrolase
MKTASGFPSVRQRTNSARAKRLAPRSNRKPDSIRRRYPVGVEITKQGAHFRVWAPEADKLEVVLESGGEEPLVRALRAGSGGYFSGLIEAATEGMRYRLRLNSDPIKTFPDPASRFQPDGPFGSSEIIHPEFSWTDADWKGVRLPGQVLYELHVGTFTKEGNWQAAARQLPELASVGVTLIEVMPVADFPGRFGWGYDGVNLFAPTWLYGRPEDFRSFVNTAHECKIGVILDVVYNHLGPDGNYLMEFAPDYFSRTYSTDWGAALNFDGDSCGPVREYILTNVAYWIQEFHLDGLRLDATQNIYDATTPHILEEVTEVARKSAKGRDVIIVAENEPQDTKLLRPPAGGGYGLDGMWNDDFHHSALVALTGHDEAYYTDHRGKPQEFISALKRVFL